MKPMFKELKFQTEGKKITYFNIKEQIEDFVSKSGIKEGILAVQSPHTTCSVIFEEMVHDFNERGDEFLQIDLNNGLEKIFPPQTAFGVEYNYPGPKHMAFAQADGDETYIKHPEILLNGPAHLKGSLLGASEVFVIHEGKLLTGTWGSVYFVDWDYNRPRNRKCYLMIIGE